MLRNSIGLSSTSTVKVGLFNLVCRVMMCKLRESKRPPQLFIFVHANQ